MKKMRCQLLKRPEDANGLEISVVMRHGDAAADVVWPSGRKPAALERLAAAPWTRNHGYGYLRTPERLLKIETLEFDEASDRVRTLTLSPAGTGGRRG